VSVGGKDDILLNKFMFGSMQYFILLATEYTWFRSSILAITLQKMAAVSFNLIFVSVSVDRSAF
jgi:hypothetical protein